MILKFLVTFVLTIKIKEVEGTEKHKNRKQKSPIISPPRENKFNFGIYFSTYIHTYTHIICTYNVYDCVFGLFL